MRRQRYQWMVAAGLAMFPISVLVAIYAGFFVGTGENEALGFPAALTWAVVGLVAVSAPGLLLSRLFLCRWYNPNRADVEKRKVLGRSQAFTKAEFLRDAGLQSLAETPELSETDIRGLPAVKADFD